jgi:hypothetical protein
MILLPEMKEFMRQPGIPQEDIVIFRKVSGLIRLKVCAKFIFSVPVSSAGID